MAGREPAAKQVERTTMTFKLISLCLLLLVSSTAGAQGQRLGTLKSVTGDVGLSQTGAMRTARVGGGLSQADRIVTGRNDSTTFILKDGTVVTVGPNSTRMYSVAPIAKVRSTSMRVLTGHFLRQMHVSSAM